MIMRLINNTNYIEENANVMCIIHCVTKYSVILSTEAEAAIEKHYIQTRICKTGSFIMI